MPGGAQGGGQPPGWTKVRQFVSSSGTVTASDTITFGLQDCFGWGRLVGYFFSDVSAAVDGARIEQSPDGTNFDIIEPAAQDVAQAPFLYPFEVTVMAKYCRLVYINGASPQTAFRAIAVMVPWGR